MPETETPDFAGVVRLRTRSSGRASVHVNGEDLEILSGMSLDIVDAVTGEVLVGTTELRLTADPCSLVLVELTEIADADGNPYRQSTHGKTFTEVYDPETGDVRVAKNLYLLADIEEAP